MTIKQSRRPLTRPYQSGSAMIEFAVVGPIISLLGLAVLQYGLLFFAKNQMNHAAFMAARAGSMGNAKISAVVTAYNKALIPLYGGGLDEAQLAESYAKVVKATGANCAPPSRDTNQLCVEVLNPTKESFDDWEDAALTTKYGQRAIANGGLAYKSPAEVRPNSGQNIQDANLIKLRITHGYLPKVPLINSVYTAYLKWLDPKTDSYHSQLVNAGLVPVVTNVTLQMQSDPVEDTNSSAPGMGNGGNPTDPGDPPVVETPPPNCQTAGCTVLSPPPPTTPGGGGCQGTSCPVCM